MFLGDYRVEIIPDTEFRLDGGAMFGVVPRVVWERVAPPDEANRIRLNMNCLFVETPTEKILVETGIGEKWTEKQTRNYGIFRTKSFAETLFEKTGCRPSDISIVVNTHLHFDHAGGNTILECGTRNAERGTESEQLSATETASIPTTKHAQNSEDRKPKTEDRIKNPHSAFPIPQSEIVPQFPNARYLVSRSEFQHAENPHERDRASYLPENWRPLQQSGQLELKPDVYEVVEGLTIENARGHSETMQTVCLKRGGETLYGFADLIPTRHHLVLPWIMGYDLYPTETLAFKRKILPLAVRENWICLFYHDFEAPLCRLTTAEEDGKIKAVGVN